MGRKEILLDSVNKLLDLNVSDEEIVERLKFAKIPERKMSPFLEKFRKEQVAKV